MIKTQPVICLETGEKFESFNECARAIGVPRSTLYNAVTKGHATRGHHYFYAEKPQPSDEFFNHPRGKARVRVRCIETGEVFLSAHDAQKSVSPNSVNGNRVSCACRSGNRYRGYHWEYVDD